MGKLILKALAGAAALATVSIATPAAAAKYIVFSDANNGTYGNDDPASTFIDTFTFTLPYARSVYIDLYSFAANFPRDNVNFVSNATRVDDTRFTNVSVGNPEQKYFSGILGAGSHTITVRGTSGPDGAYSGTLLFAGVPEPSTWALFILGFGAIGFSLRNRKKVNVAVRYA